MASGIRYEAKPTFRDLAGRFATANRDIIEDKRDWVRNEGRRYVRIAKRHAPEGKTGRFKGTIRFRTFGTGDTVGFTTSAAEPLATWIRKGTRPHLIVGRPFLSFFWEKLGRQVVFRRVNHPGTKPNDFVQRAYDEWLPGAKVTFRRISTRWIAKVRG